MAMKKTLIMMTSALVVMAMLTACTNDGESEVMNHETAEVRMTFAPYEVEPMTRAAVADYATRLDVWIYDGDTEVQAVHQQSTDEGFASLSVRLEKAKTYTVYACAHKAAGAATLSNGVVSWQDDKVTHSFFYSQTFKITFNFICYLFTFLALNKCINRCSVDGLKNPS